MPRSRSQLPLPWLLLVAPLLAPGCSDAPVDLGAPACAALSLARVPPDANVVLILNDAMRRDRAGAYGGTARTPHFDAFARDGLLFERALASAPWTKPSIASLFTSLHPSQHGVASDPDLQGAFGIFRSTDLTRADVLPDELPTLAESLAGAGFRTAAFVANPWLRRRFGFAQGFEHYDDSFASFDAPGTEVNRAALAWLDSVGDGERFFLYLHYIDSHRPYGHLTRDELDLVAPEDTRRLPARGEQFFRNYITLEDGTRAAEAGAVPSVALIERAYDRGVEDFDAALGALLASLERHPAWPRTAVVITSDHGEALFDRGYGNHGAGLFDDEAAVPLAARLPGVAPARGRVDCLVGLVDLMPSLCAYLGVECPSGVQGWSFFDGRPQERRLLVTEGVMTRPLHRAVRGARWKLLYEPDGRRDGREGGSAWSLYDMERDPAERHDLLAGDPDPQTQRIFAQLERALGEAVAEAAPPERRTAPVDPELAERLRALGYGED
jgi:choline-sulfatase